jgi:hypothetical protein
MEVQVGEEEIEMVFVRKIQVYCSDYQKVQGSICFVIVTSLASRRHMIRISAAIRFLPEA